MKRLYAYILLSVFLFSCTSDDDTECLTILPINSNIVIELLNTQGENLIGNGTYNPDAITVDFDGNTFTNVVFTDASGIESFIAINIFGEDGDNTFEINLSDTETDILVLNITREETGGPCSQFLFTLNSVTYNAESKDVQSLQGDFLITVVKE